VARRVRHDPRLARQIYAYIREHGYRHTYDYWLGIVKDMARAAGIDFDVRTGPAPTGRRMAHISVKLPPETVARLDEIARRMGVPRSELVRLGIELVLDLLG